MSDINMSELIKVAKAQQMEKDQAKTQKVKNKVVVTNVQSYEHGGYVTTDDGSGAIVIDNDHELRKMQENDVTGKTLLNLIHHNGLIVDANAYVPDYGDNAPENYDPGVEYINNNPYDQKAMDMKKIKQQFASLTYGPEGLVNVNDPKGKLVTEALEKLRSGEIVLPSPEEYKEQKRIAKEKREKNNSVTVKRNQSSNDRPIELNDTKQKEIEELVMPSVPENAVMKKGVLEQLNEMNLRGTKPSVPVTVKHTKQPEGVPTPNPIEHTEPIKNTPPQQKAPINLAEMEEIVNNNEVSTEQATPTPEEKSDVAVFNVPEGQVSDFMKTLPMETFNKVASSKVIQVNEVELKDVPTASRRITSIAEYRRLSQHRANNKTVEITERVLVNSGFVVTLKAATSLEMATIFKNPMSEEVDWEKSYRFCYEHTVDTSIGRLSFNEYVMKVSPSDIETVLNGIYELSETFERNISVSCGKRDGCGLHMKLKSKYPIYQILMMLIMKRKNVLRRLYLLKVILLPQKTYKCHLQLHLLNMLKWEIEY